MKKVRLILFLALLFELHLSKASVGATPVETRTAKVSVQLAKDATIELKAKYTDLAIERWDKDEVYIEATIRFDGKMNRKMETFLDSFQQEVENGIEKSSNSVLIDTNLDEPNKVQIGSKNIGLFMGFSTDELKINYLIKAPGNRLIEIDHSYKDLSIDGHFEAINLTQYSGDLKIESIEKGNLNLKYGSAKIGKISVAKLTLYEQELRIATAGELDLNAKYSDLDFGKTDVLKAQSYESDFELLSVSDMEGNFKYGDINFKKELLNGTLELYEMDLEGSLLKRLVLINSKYSKFDFDKVERLHFEQSYEDEVKIETLGNLTAGSTKYAKFQIGQLTESFAIDAYEADVSIDGFTPETTLVSLTGKYIKARIDQLPDNYRIEADTKYGKVTYDEDQVDIKKYIKESDKLLLEAESKRKGPNPLIITLSGFELTADLK